MHLWFNSHDDFANCLSCIVGFHMRQCEFKDTKFCKVKIKLIALCWYLVTITFQCQTNLEIHCSPTMHNVQDKTKICLIKINERVIQINYFIYGAVFLDNLCLYLNFYINQTLSPFWEISDIMAILPLQYCKSFKAACTLEGRN